MCRNLPCAAASTVNEPISHCQEAECERSVLLTMHGTTVPPQNQADSYKHMVDGKFVFGLEHAWTLAPTRWRKKTRVIDVF